MYPPNKKREALDLWFATYGEFSIAEFTAQLGYPDSGTMSRWTRADPRHDPGRAQYRSKPIAPKLEAIGRVAGGESVSSAARAVGPSRGQVRVSVDMHAEGGTAALPPKATARRTAGMAKKKTAPGKAPYEAPPQIPAELPDDPDELKAIIGRLEFDNAVLREALAVLKADPAFTPGGLARDEKAKAALALQPRYGAVAACAALGLAHSTFYSVIGRLTRPDRDDGLDGAVARAFLEDGAAARGHRLVAARVAQALGRPVSEKRVRRSMAKQGFEVRCAGRRRRYSSYGGEIDPPAPNLLLRDDGAHRFRAGRPNEVWASDIAQFSLPDDGRKVYPSPVIDLFDGKPVGWPAGLRPDAELANSSLRAAALSPGPGEGPIVRTDRGCHYRWDGWKAVCSDFGLTRSMSRKATSPDNAACEGFFGAFKNEVFYGRDWSGWTAEEFMALLETMMRWWSSGRLKGFRDDGPLRYDTIDGRRMRLGLAA